MDTGLKALKWRFVNGHFYIKFKIFYYFQNKNMQILHENKEHTNFLNEAKRLISFQRIFIKIFTEKYFNYETLISTPWLFSLRVSIITQII